MNIKYYILFLILLFNISWAEEEVVIKAVPNQSVIYTSDVTVEVVQRMADKVVPIATASSESELSLMLSTEGTMEEIVLTPASYLFKGKFGPLSLVFDLKNSNGEHPITQYIKKELFKTHMLPLTIDRNILTAPSDRYSYLPIAEENVDGYISFVSRLQAFMKIGKTFKVGTTHKTYDDFEHTTIVTAINPTTVESTHELKWEDKVDGSTGSGKILVTHDRSNLLLSQGTGDFKIILKDNPLKTIPGYDVEGPVEITLKFNVHSRL